MASPSRSAHLLAVSVSLSIDQPFLRELWSLCKALPYSEVSGYGEVHRARGTGLHIPNVLHVPPQTVSAGHTTFMANESTRGMGDLADIVHEYIVASRDPDPAKRKDPSWLRFWFHSHAMHAAFFSSTDENTIAKLAEETEPMLFVAGVMNHRGQSCWRVVINHVHITMDYDLEGLDPSPAEIESARRRWLGDHVKVEANYGSWLSD